MFTFPGLRQNKKNAPEREQRCAFASLINVNSPSRDLGRSVAKARPYMDHVVANKLVMRFHRATSLPVMEAKRLLATMPQEEQQKYTNAAESSQNGLVNDPIEDDPENGPIIRSVLKAVSKQVQEEHDLHIAELEQTSPAVADLIRSGRGLCHSVWHKAKQRLKDEHGIEWKTPAEMTPWIMID